MRSKFIVISTAALLIVLGLTIFLNVNWGVLLVILLVLTIMGYQDMYQKPHALRRIYPLVGRLRYVMEDFVQKCINIL